jgi:6-pyruvoyltetrahydropterin/6-carboxytetrahydropterin synthase
VTPSVLTASRRYKFSASHRLHSPALSDDANRELFGKCNRPFGHGHNYEVEVIVRGEIDPASGRVVDLARLDELVLRSIVARYDHRYLNEELPEFQTEVPTTENLGRQIEKRLAEQWPFEKPALEGIRIFETDRNRVEVQHHESPKITQ